MEFILPMNVRTRSLLRFSILISLIVLVLMSSATPSAGQNPNPTGISNLDIVLVIDESGSMWETNDPQIKAAGQVTNPGWRIVGANLLAEWLGVDQSGSRHRLSVI